MTKCQMTKCQMTKCQMTKCQMTKCQMTKCQLTKCQMTKSIMIKYQNSNCQHFSSPHLNYFWLSPDTCSGHLTPHGAARSGQKNLTFSEHRLQFVLIKCCFILSGVCTPYARYTEMAFLRLSVLHVRHYIYVHTFLPKPLFLFSTHKQCLLSKFIHTQRHCNGSPNNIYRDGIHNK
jgi:hypothetical protein